MTRRLRVAWLLVGLLAAAVIPMRIWEIAAPHFNTASFVCGR
ncbi:hypothetical protein [Xanthomonas arboricola]|nr:hypothetical protein [Xanthomonas arboricola]